VQKLGTDPQTGLDVSAFRYKGDPKSYPKVVGVMADDVEDKMPGSTTKVGGNQVINANGLAGMGASPKPFSKMHEPGSTRSLRPAKIPKPQSANGLRGHSYK
jgi:hypothetical protein